MLTLDEILAIYAAGPEAVVDCVQALQQQVQHLRPLLPLAEQIPQLQQQNQQLADRVKRLEDRLGKDSHNSSKPPSSDALTKKPRPKSLREKSERSSGAQPGHPGRTLPFAEQPDHTVVHRPDHCQHCGTSLGEAPVLTTERRQVFDLPALALVVTEHQVQTCCCPHCGTSHRADFPETVSAPVQYGPGVKGLVAYLMHFQLLPYERVGTLMQDLFGAPLSEGTLLSTTQHAFVALASVEADIVAALKKAKRLHCDETGQRIHGTLHWLHVTSTERLTYYASHPKRGKKALDAIGILPGYQGRVSHDGWSAYSAYPCQHSLCNSHHLRELTAIQEQQQQPWARQMKALLLQIKQAVEDAGERGAPRLHPLLECRFEGRYRALLAAGYAANAPPEPTGRPGRDAQTPARNLLVRLDQGQTAVLAFMYDFSVPFDNNQAERDLRMMKVKQKISGGFRSQEGADAFCRIRGYICTLRKQGHQVLSALQSVFLGKPLRPDLAT